MDRDAYRGTRLGMLVLLALAGATLACGGGGGGGGGDAGTGFAVTGFSPGTIPSEQATSFTVTGRDFGPVGQGAEIAITATSGTPFRGGVTGRVLLKASIESETLLRGTTDLLGAVDVADARITVMLPDGRETTSSGALVTVEPPQPTLLDPSVLRSCMPIHFDVEGSGLGAFGTTVTIRFTAPSGTPFLGGTSDHLEVESILSDPTSILAALPWDATRSDFVADTTFIWPSGAQAHLPNSAWFRPELELIDGTGYAGDAAGSAVAIDGSYAVVARPEDGLDGSVDVYLRSGESWAYQATLRPNDASDVGSFGTSVAISEDTILVGRPRSDGIGAVHAFVRSGVVWREEQIITPPLGVGWDSFGFSVAIQGDFALIGARQGGLSTGRGYAWTFTRSGTTWTADTRFTAPTADVWDFGWSVALGAGTPPTLFIGIPGGTDPYGSDPATYWDTGSVAVYSKSTGSWSRTAWFHPELGRNGDSFGASVSADGALLAVGAPWRDHLLTLDRSGSVYVFDSPGADPAVWDEHSEIWSHQRVADGEFGTSVAIQAGILVVGAPEEAGNVAGSGAIHMYDGGTDGFDHVLTLGARFGADGDAYGTAVDIDDGRVIVGAPGQDLVAPDGGQATIH